MWKSSLLLLVVTLAILSGFVVFERSFSQPFAQCVAGHQNEKGQTPPKEDGTFLGLTVNRYTWCSGDFVESNKDAITALATLIIAVFTATLWIATNNQATITRHAFIAQKRAFVFATGIRGLYEPDQSGNGLWNWRLSPIWQNSGDTATRGLRFYCDCLLSNSAMPPTFPLEYVDPAVGFGSGMMGPKFSSPAGQAPHPHKGALTPQDILDVQGGKKFLYIWGSARYQDVPPFPADRLSRFCWRIIITGNPMLFNPAIDPNSVHFTNAYETRGNCADDECKLQGLA
jgi:hypothetical protein